jgi:serine/threonine-protein kinase RsbW
MVRHGGENDAPTERSLATAVAVAINPGGQPAPTRLAAQRAKRPMLYCARMAREAQLELLSQYENIELAERILAEVGRSCGFADEALYWVGMALREAVANAIKHGNKLSPEKRVYVRYQVEPDGGLRIIVEDEGDGFDPSTVSDPTDPKNLLRESGRGVFYMRSFMDEVHFGVGDRGGTRIELIKRLPQGRM